MFKLALLSILMNYFFFFFHYVTNFNVNSSLHAKIRSVFHENKVPKLLMESENPLERGWLQPKAKSRMCGFFRPLAWQAKVLGLGWDLWLLAQEIGQPQRRLQAPCLTKLLTQPGGQECLFISHLKRRSKCRPHTSHHGHTNKGSNFLQNGSKSAIKRCYVSSFF